MIAYEPGRWGLCFIFRVKGSVFPKAAFLAAASALLAVMVKLFIFSWHDTGYMNGVEEIWSGYTFVLGFLIVFRINQSYARFWEGATLTKQFRGEWFLAVSNVFAFCSRDESKKADVVRFQHVFVRLASLLHCSALQQICALQGDSLEIINSDAMDAESMAFLRTCVNQHEVVTNWIQRLIVQATDACIVDVPAPILSRVFQEIGNGVVNLNNARKNRDVPFPFPYAQVISCMLCVHWLLTPILAAHQIGSAIWAGIMSFLVALSFWSLYYLALEMDQPFGEDANDLPIQAMQEEWNNSLLTLLHPRCQVLPTFDLTDSQSKEPHQSEVPSSPKQLFRRHSHGPRHAEFFRETVLTNSATSAPMRVTIHSDCPVEEVSPAVSVIRATSMELVEGSKTGMVSVTFSDYAGSERIRRKRDQGEAVNVSVEFSDYPGSGISRKRDQPIGSSISIYSESDSDDAGKSGVGEINQDAESDGDDAGKSVVSCISADPSEGMEGQALEEENLWLDSVPAPAPNSSLRQSVALEKSFASFGGASVGRLRAARPPPVLQLV
ncbi:unnamed protein product [Polarella glacialis]|uniref:Bestrophin homolog n=1 Tax=Polarella glacialis TaxID=89957 RepID=A0A813KWN2_POLGL|nr:unnamed protein product [Polarella glacialis]